MTDLAGELKNFPGIDDPYEAPEDPEVLVETDEEALEESLAKVIVTLEVLGLIPKVDDGSYSAYEEAKVQARLSDLGYI